MEYQIGDKVRIREDLKMYETYNEIRASEGMLKYGGEIAVITKQRSTNQYVLGVDRGEYFWTPEMFDRNYKPESENYMKTSEFKAELKKLGYTFDGSHIKKNLAIAWISALYVNAIDTTYDPEYGREVSPKLFSLITRYAATPIAEREDEKLFNVQIIKGNWGRASWLYRYDDGISTSVSAVNNHSRQQWTLEQIKAYGIDDETVYKRMPVED